MGFINNLKSLFVKDKIEKASDVSIQFATKFTEQVLLDATFIGNGFTSYVNSTLQVVRNNSVAISKAAVILEPVFKEFKETIEAVTKELKAQYKIRNDESEIVLEASLKDLQEAFELNGYKSFTFQILKIVSKKDLDEKEKEYIKEAISNGSQLYNKILYKDKNISNK